MTSFPLPTMATTIDENGISAPAYADILTNIQLKYQQLYGSDIDIDDDTQDGQMLAVLAQGFNDDNSATIGAFNAFSPANAQGIGLSSVVKINNLKRQAYSNSTVDITISGTAGTTINKALIGDSVGLNTQWALPPSFVIPDDGTAIVQAICTTPGAITAEDGTLTAILTPTRGWQAATNANNANPGNPVEEDATLRIRQSTSQNPAAQSVASATAAAIGNIPDVTLVTYEENYTGTTDINGVPKNSISYIVAGGDPVAICQTIAAKKSMGCNTYGTTSETVNDPAGVPITINFFVLEYSEITVVVNISALSGYVDTTAVLIQTAVANYISSLPPGGTVYWNKVWAIAALMTSQLNTTFDITSLTLNAADDDITIAFNYNARCITSDVTVNVSG